MKEYKRRFGAMALAVALTLSLIPTSLIPQAWAAEGDSDDGGTPTLQGNVSAVGSKPTLHIDFLGEDLDYYLTYAVPTPKDHDVSLNSHATAAADASWDRYRQGDEYDDRIFWVGIGIDKMDAFELAQQGGLYSAEFALYYNTNYVLLPDYDDNTGAGDFESILQSYNLGQGAVDPKTQWDGDLYSIRAREDLDPVGDPVTEEYALSDKIRPGNGEWRMLYASVERKEGFAGMNRFAVLPGNDDTYYLMMIPFVLQDWDPNLDICFRLARNASLFSVGSGVKGEALTAEQNTPAGGFGAWEKETRNPNHNLKEMFDFEGDLNIFTGEREKDTHFAQLNIDNGGSTNGAELSITNDYSTPPVMVDTDGSRINDLQPGTSMTVELTGTGNGYTASVTVTRVNDGQQVTLTPDPGDPGRKFTFIMPGDDVNVNVTYLANDETGNFNATLHVVDGGDAVRNTATMQEKLPDGTDLNPPAAVAGPATSAAPATTVVKKGDQIKVFIPHDAGGDPLYNTDYDVTVTAVTTTGSNVQVTTDIANEEYSLTMPASDVDITVTYAKAVTYNVQLVVDEDQNGFVDNKAELYFYDGEGNIHSVTADQKTQPHDPTMGGARDGRQINGIISLHKDTNPTPPPAMVPDYQIKKVTLFYSDGVTPPVDLDFHPITAAEIAADPYMANGEWYITMPDGSPVEMPAQDITIKVEFEKIGLYNVQLILNDADSVTGNTATLKGTDSVLGTTPSTNMPTVDNFDIHSGSHLELDIQTAPGYKVAKVEARNTTNGALESPSGGSIASGHLEYRMPADNLKITVFYEREDNNLYRATLQLTPNVPSGSSNTAAWVTKDGTAYVPPVYPRVENYSGTVLESDIQVAPGWHISTVEVISETGIASYPFSITGNGYNNGAGGTVKLTMTQPADHVLVKILFANNPPPEEPKRLLDLAVRDDDNRPGNKAQLWVNGSNLSGDVSATGGYGIYSTNSAAMGDKIRVTMDCEPGYYISDVTVTPVGAGVTPDWVSDRAVEFTMPAGNATVTVTYKPIDPENPPTHKVTLHTDPASLPAGNNARIEDNAVHTPALPAPNQALLDGESIVTYTGDKVTVDVTTAVNKVALVYAIQPGGMLTLTPVGSAVAGGAIPANTYASYTFIAPNADADVYVKYMDPEDLGDYVASLTVIDDEGGANGAAGSATLTRSGSGSGSVTVQGAAMPGNTDVMTANAGDGMVLTVSPQSGYSVSVAYVTPSGAATLLWSGTQTASFVMPNKDVGVVVRFHKGDATKYTVDLNVTGPDGAGVASLGAVSTAGIYSQQHEAGDGVDFAITANPGYYIQSVTVTPTPLGVIPSLSGTVGSQSGGFTMPAANVHVNVVFAKGYPDTAEYAATLKVVDPSAPLGGTAQMKNTDPARLAATNQLSGGQQETLKARGGDVMEVEIAANPGYVPTITIRDNAGNPVNYQWSDATHIRFDMANGPTLVEVRFDKGEKREYNVTLHVEGLPGDNASITVTPAGTPTTTVTVPAGASVGTPSSIQAQTGSTIQVIANATATPAGYVQSVVVMQGANMISITPVANYDAGSYTGTFTVPEGDVDVYVYTGDTAGPTEPEYPVMLTATATDGSAIGVAGEAWIAPSDGSTVDMTNKSANAQSEGASVYFSAVGGGHYRVHGAPNSGYVVSAIRLTPAGSGLSTVVSFTWIDGETVEFDMPFQPIGIEVEFKPADEVPDRLTAQVVVNGDGNVNNKGEIYETANGPTAGQTLIVTSNGTDISVDITVATGYEIEFVELRSNIFGVNNLPLVKPADQSQTISFTMLPDDVVVYVKMKKAAATTFTATLEIVDTSSAFINTASMSAGSTTVTGHGKQITGLADGDQVSTVPIPNASAWNNNEVRLVAVLATDKNGTTTLGGVVNGSTTQYDYAIQGSDVTITVIYADYTEKPEEKTYVAKVVKADPTGNDSNTATIQNTENTALPHGTTWTQAWPGHALQVNVTAASGYYAVVTATRDDTGASVPVMQIGSAGNVTAYLNLPNDGGGASSDVTVKVEYIQGTPPAASHKATIDLVNHSTLGGSGSATMTERSNTANTNTDTNGADNVGADLPQSVAEGAQLDITTMCMMAHVSLITLTSNGVTVTLTKADGGAVAVMPNGDAVVKVYIEDDDPTPRPYDPVQDPSGNSYIDGYLKAKRGDQGRAVIEVPYLYSSGTIYNAPNSVTYHLYVKAGSEYVRLIPGVDYEVTDGYEEYATTPMGTSTGIGTRFTIRALEGNTSLSDWLVNGGVIYITAARPAAQPGTWSESDYVEVELPADPLRGKHKATLRIVDFSSKTGNGATMSDGYRTVSVDGGILDDLLGSELIKTSVTVGEGAVLVGVTVTDSVGSRPLSPDGAGRYPYDMTGEDIVITVYFDDDGTLDPDDPELYIASVQKAGLSGVAGNDADIHNSTRNDLPSGVIWAAGYAGNDMSVDVDTAPGCYAIVTAYTATDNTPLPVVQLGAGDPAAATSFQAFVSIPDGSLISGVAVAPDDVRVVVTFTKEKPDNYESALTLTNVGTNGPTTVTGNSAELQPNGMAAVLKNEDGTWLVPDGTNPPATASTTLVPVGTTLELATTCDTNYYVDSVVVTIATSPAGTMTVTLDANGEVAFPMPLGASDVKVTWKQGAHTLRPYDPTHEPPIAAPATQPGWILAEHTLDQNGDTTNNGLRITVPTLHEGTPADPYYNAINTVDPDDITYKLYIKDSYGAYHALTGTDISRTQVTMGTTNVGAITYNTATFELTSLLAASTLHYYIKHGGVIYITATDTGAFTGTAKDESYYTEVVIPANYTATIHVSQGTVTGNSAKLSDPGGRSVIAPPDRRLTGLGGTETLTTIPTAVTGSHLVSVIATTASGGSVHLNATGSNYDYTMVGEDVDIYVVFQDDDDPLGDLYTATVERVNDDGKAGNTASIVNEDVSTVPTGTIWTGAYEENVVRVDVTTEPGYYATVTAFLTGTTTPVPVVQWATQGSAANPAEAHFTMPAHDVDVTVTYSTEPPEPNELKLTLVDTNGRQGNSATLEAPNSTNAVTILGNSAVLTQSVPNRVSAGTLLTLTTTTATGYAIKEAYMEVTTAGGTVRVAIPLTNGAALPLPVMPLGEAEVFVVYMEGHQTPRPYDPAHAHVYTSSYNHNSTDDLSSTHQDGWILAQATGSDSLHITVPVLHDMSGAGGTDQLHHAGYNDPQFQPSYKLYWRDSLGFHEFQLGYDIEISNGQFVANTYSVGATVYNGYEFDVEIKSATALWGGYHLDQYLKNGGSIYITATGSDTTAPDVESEKTEVVVPKNDHFTATLHIQDVSGLTGNGVTMSEVGGTQAPVTVDLGQLTDLTAGTTVRT
ncbi:hypothetical protein, partial [Vermiculatibacterium agrestimuris]|uniref:hypothetical protein n=1 Tax=Vermiculatibacterium agrestimuris TaxID=2941519 RepID=UPI002040D26D